MLKVMQRKNSYTFFRTIPRRKINLYKGETKDILLAIFHSKSKKTLYIEQFEREFSKFIGCKHAIAVSSGRHALEIILRVLHFEKGDEIIFPAYTLSILPKITKELNLTPVFVDIDENTLNINPSLLEKKITKKTKAIIATHLFGSPCDLKNIIQIAKKHDIVVIEDCAHACGSTYMNRKVGSFGKASFFSFSTAKPLNTFSGGIITTNDDEIAKTIRDIVSSYKTSFRNLITQLIIGYVEILLSGTFIFFLLTRFRPVLEKIIFIYKKFKKHSKQKHFKFSYLQALIGLKQLENLDETNNKRIKNAQHLTKLLGKNIITQKKLPNAVHIYYQYVIRMNHSVNIEKIARRLLNFGIDVGIKDEIMNNCPREFGLSEEYPFTDKVWKSSLQIPIYANLSKEKIEYIARVLNKIAVCDNEL